MTDNSPSDTSDLERENRTLNKRLDRMQRKLSSMEILQAQNNNVMRALMRDLEAERAESERLLLNILPEQIAQRLKSNKGVIADRFEEASVLFADIVGFTALTRSLSADEMVAWLNEVYSQFDEFVQWYNIEKIRTIGDNYMVASGVPDPRDDHAVVLADLALKMREHVASMPPVRNHRISFRIGINSGPVVGGVIGTHKFQYDVWGEAVNLASRMESHGEPGRIQVTNATYKLIKNDFVCKPRGTVQVKGEGELESWFVEGRASSGSD